MSVKRSTSQKQNLATYFCLSSTNLVFDNLSEVVTTSSSTLTKLVSTFVLFVQIFLFVHFKDIKKNVTQMFVGLGNDGGLVNLLTFKLSIIFSKQKQNKLNV